MADPTAEQRKAIRAFIDSTLLPLIGDVLEKKLTQAALTIRDLLEDTPAGVAPSDESEPVFHLRSYGDVSREDLERIAGVDVPGEGRDAG